MKPNPSLHRRSTGRGKRRQEKGVALVTVLAIVLLMSVLVMSFFEMAKSELNSSIKESDNLKARSFADAAVNIAISQIREATTQKSTNDEFAPWSSQPGAIRVYQPYGDLKAIYKLYSSTKMLTDSLTALEKEDLKKDWDSEPDQWVDINAPIVNPNLDEKNTEQSEVFWPIADPRAARGQARDSVEGFSYKDAVNGVVRASGGRANSQRLPMPVRWLYLLADGTVGTLSKSGEFVAPSGGGEPSKDNQIVGRIGFWTDDETCKINVNTASEGVYWDTPRSSSEEDKWLGQSQPVNGEFQRYPGHPAMVCMSSVLFPNKRFKGLKSESAPPTGGSIDMKDMEVDEVQSIWRMSPYIYGEDSDKSSFGGRKKPSAMTVAAAGSPTSVKTLSGQPNPKHLYNSYDDYLVAANSDAKIDGKPSDIDVKERKPVGDKLYKLPVDRIQQARFFLTTRSSAPEISMGGLPRVALWPIDNTVIPELANTKTAALKDGGKYTIFDTLIGFNASLRKGATVYPFFLTRQDVGSRHAEQYVYNPRDVVLWNYLTKAFLTDIPGFGLRRADPSGNNFKNFADKYGGTQFDDLPAITAQFIDYIHDQNLSDGNLPVGQRYVAANAFGQVTPICMCGGSDQHARTWFIAVSPSPKGMGRFLTVSEVALVVGLRAMQTGGATTPTPVKFHPDNEKLVPNPPDPGTDFYEYEAGLLVEAFSPAQGWGEFRPRCTFTLGGLSGGGAISEAVKNTQTGATDRSIGKMDLCGKQLVFGGGAESSFTATIDGAQPPKDWIGWGGSLGVRVTPTMITFKPILFPVTPGNELPAFKFSGTAGSQNHLRLIVYDTVEGSAGLDTGNLIQFIPLAFPENQGGYPLPRSNPKPFRKYPVTPAGAGERMADARANGVIFGANGLIHPGDIVQSLVPNHGDFRLLASKRAVMQGRGNGVADTAAREYPTFVAHPNYGLKGSPMAHSLMEAQPEKNLTIPHSPVKGVSNDFGYFTKDHNSSTDLKLKPEYMPDFPIKPWEENVSVKLVGKLSIGSLSQGALSGGHDMSLSMKEVFNITRYDHLTGDNFKRGAARPDITGDFDNGVGPARDGPYNNHGDDGEVRGSSPYFSLMEAKGTTAPGTNGAMFSPNRVIPSAGVFGSLPTGVAANVPWQTLLFRPDIELSKSQTDRERRHYGSRSPRDHLFMDMFWMPVVQPYAISEPFETKGKINMNYQILPFTYITRATALHALLKSEKVMAIPDERTDDYKIGHKEGGGDGSPYESPRTAVFRHFIDAEQTLKQFEERFAGTDESSTSRGIKPGAFLCASEICDEWLVPQGQTRETMVQFWQNHRQTGDNTKERPYANLYPRLTTRSNAYRVHVVAQALSKTKKGDQRSFQPLEGDRVTAEYRGSYLIERSIDPSDPDLKDYATAVANLQDYDPLDKFYFYRISQVKQFVR